MERLARWLPLLIAAGVLLALHGWHLQFMFKGEVPLQRALFTSLREVSNTVLLLLPVWLPVVMPSKWPVVSKWVTLACGAISLAIALSFAVVALLREERFFVAVVAIYGAVGLLHLARSSWRAPRLASSRNNGT